MTFTRSKVRNVNLKNMLIVLKSVISSVSEIAIFGAIKTLDTDTVGELSASVFRFVVVRLIEH
jgi:hypothetical protein